MTTFIRAYDLAVSPAEPQSAGVTYTVLRVVLDAYQLGLYYTVPPTSLITRYPVEGVLYNFRPPDNGNGYAY
jgi:hypothetical protein